jgi:predicted lysophospholipase L1 biosynthesis ABC-type transport system permease subunit
MVGFKLPADARAALQAAVRRLDPRQPIAKFASLDTVMGDQVATRRFTTFLLTMFAAAALAIAGVGIYGLLSYLVAQRRQEFGVRVALGAQPRDLLRIVVGRVMALAAWACLSDCWAHSFSSAVCRASSLASPVLTWEATWSRA